jgi:DNA-binding NtrC family response regulator
MRILCVDDDFLLLKVLVHCLAPRSVALALDSQTAREHLARHPVDCVITDVQMPGEDGWSLAEFISQTYPGIPIFMMSSLENPRVFPPYILGFIQKPFDCCQVILMIEKFRAVEKT